MIVMPPISILIAEDDPFLKRAYELWFNKEGFVAQVVDNGQEIIRSLESAIPDIIILDVMMPELGGFDTLKKIKEDEKTKNIPVILASSLSQPEDIKRAQSMGADLWIVKSDIQLEALTQQIKTLIESKS